MKPVVIKRQIINDMETISITYRGLVHKLTEYEKLADTIETIYAMLCVIKKLLIGQIV